MKSSIFDFFSDKNAAVTQTILSDSDFYKPLSAEEIEEYISTNEPYDKAGGYAIQGSASKFISSMEGDYFNIVGLSISSLYDILKDFR